MLSTLFMCLIFKPNVTFEDVTDYNDGVKITDTRKEKHEPENWFKEKEEVTNYDYSFAFVGDTQQLSEKYPEHVYTLYDWILNNKESKNIEYVFGLGDITEGDADWEWDNNKNAISKMNGVIPYSLIRGNHDTTAKFYRTFGNAEYMNQFTGFYKENNINSSYRTINIGPLNFLMMTLDYGADDAELEWAASIIEKYPNHKVIITTHAYMYLEGKMLSSSHGIMPSYSNDDDKPSGKIYNSGENMWDELVSKYGNIVLVCSGHVDHDHVVYRQDEGLHGNIVTQMLIDPQTMDKEIDGGCGMICMMYFDKDFTNLQIEWYSTVRDEFYGASDQFSIDSSKRGESAHNYDVSYNNTFHWASCECGKNMINFGEHEFDGICDDKCNSCDFTRETTHTYESTGYTDEGHYVTCSICDSKLNDKIYPHVYDDEHCDSTCNVCGYKRKVTHDYSIHHYDSEYHYDECSRCHKENIISKGTHTYDNDCDSTCNECEYKRYVTHKYSLTKIDGKTHYKECEVCGEKVILNVNNGLWWIPVIVGGVLVIGGGTTFAVIKLKKKDKA
jgi:hypothetical protein